MQGSSVRKEVRTARAPIAPRDTSAAEGTRIRNFARARLDSTALRAPRSLRAGSAHLASGAQETLRTSSRAWLSQASTALRCRTTSTGRSALSVTTAPADPASRKIATRSRADSAQLVPTARWGGLALLGTTAREGKGRNALQPRESTAPREAAALRESCAQLGASAPEEARTRQTARLLQAPSALKELQQQTRLSSVLPATTALASSSSPSPARPELDTSVTWDRPRRRESYVL
mmetsp:Transcript_28925/g.65541  ORF Transcript_28925/g.65541 Transcript_28925/m.65541 type:complete len:235 (+) Transcript_28925:446-1150(+)